ncbi:MAG: VOC family protein [Chitinophagaceae bacterium]|nr:VOC family protein [Chitinophagaceae bacterium]
MKEKITPCLWFNAQAQEAATLYCAVFENAKITSQSPIVTEISISGQQLILLDGGPIYQPNASISFYYICENEQELNNIWKSFSEGGKIMMPLDKYPWGEKYGWIADKFGVSWQIALGKISDVGQKITPSLMFVGDQYGRAQEAIDHYSTIFKDPSIDGVLKYGANESPDEEGKVKHAQVSLSGQKFMFMDSAHAHQFNFSEGISLTIHCENQEEIDYYWGRLTESGNESMCGWLRDKFGVSWQVIPRMLSKIMSDPKKSGKAVKAFMTMKKIDIEQIVQASIA